MEKEATDCFPQQKAIFGSLPRVSVNFWRQQQKLRKHKAFMEDVVTQMGTNLNSSASSWWGLLSPENPVESGRTGWTTPSGINLGL